MSKFFLKIVEAQPIFAGGNDGWSRTQCQNFFLKIVEAQPIFTIAKIDVFTEKRYSRRKKIVHYTKKLYFCTILSNVNIAYSVRFMRYRLTKFQMLLLLAEVIAVAVLAVVATGHFGIVDGMRITAAYLVAYLVPLFLLKRARGTSDAAHGVFLLIAIFMSILALDCLVSWTSADGYSLQRPNLPGDARDYYKWALWRYDGSAINKGVTFPGFPLMMLGLWKVFDLSVIWPQAMNMMFTMSSVVLTGKMTRRLLTHYLPASPSNLLLGGMSLMCILPFYLVSGVLILKEGVTFLAFTMGGYALVSLAGKDRREFYVRDFIIFLIACVMLAFVRTTFLYFMAVGVIVMTLPHWRRDWLLSLLLLLLIALLMLLGNHFAAYSFYRHAEVVDGGWNMQRAFNRYYDESIIGFYFLYSPWHRLLLLPLTMAVQFFLPFPVPWIPVAEVPYLQCVFSRLTYGWYLFGGTAVFYCLFMAWRRSESIGAWTWWPVIIYVITAYVMGGTMARYVLPFQPLMVPMVLFVLYRLHQGHWRRPYIIWMAVLVVLLLAGLIYYSLWR